MRGIGFLLPLCVCALLASCDSSSTSSPVTTNGTTNTSGNTSGILGKWHRIEDYDTIYYEFTQDKNFIFNYYTDMSGTACFSYAFHKGKGSWEFTGDTVFLALTDSMKRYSKCKTDTGTMEKTTITVMSGEKKLIYSKENSIEYLYSTPFKLTRI